MCQSAWSEEEWVGRKPKWILSAPRRIHSSHICFSLLCHSSTQCIYSASICLVFKLLALAVVASCPFPPSIPVLYNGESLALLGKACCVLLSQLCDLTYPLLFWSQFHFHLIPRRLKYLHVIYSSFLPWSSLFLASFEPPDFEVFLGFFLELLSCNITKLLSLLSGKQSFLLFWDYYQASLLIWPHICYIQ